MKSFDTPDGFEQHREWEKQLFAGRWAVVTWPEVYGGRDCSLIEWLIFEEEYYAAGGPFRISANGVTLLGPTLFEFGTQEQKDRFLPKMASGEEIWAQGWSEPNAGSDLAGIKTKAIRDGEWFVVNGQKTWTTRGAFADWLFCIFRTDPDAERHRGLTYFLVPVDTPGLTRRAVGRLDGEPGFSEVFFEDARVHESAILGGDTCKRPSVRMVRAVSLFWAKTITARCCVRRAGPILDSTRRAHRRTASSISPRHPSSPNRDRGISTPPPTGPQTSGLSIVLTPVRVQLAASVTW